MTLYAQGSSVTTFSGATLFDQPVVNINATQNDFDPSCLTDCSSIGIVALAAGLTITGFARARQGRFLKVVNVGAVSFTLANQSGASAANHQMNLGSSITLTPGAVVNLYCENVTAGWWLDSTSVSGGGGGGGGIGTYLSVALPAGASNNWAPAGFGTGVGRIDVTPAGVANVTGLQAGADAQVLIIGNIGGSNVTLNALNGGSSAANQFRAPADLVLVPNNSVLLCYYSAISQWVIT